MTPTNFRRPKTGERKLRVQFRNGRHSIHEYTVGQLRWTDTGSDWDIVGVEKAK
jgi:hypothetical protein